MRVRSWIWAFFFLAACEEPTPPAPVPEGSSRHVQLIHLDGFRSDVFRSLLESGRLPHFESLLSRGKISYSASTVDKSETMKAIPAYLGSRLDTEVVGWWQFSRSDFRFRNFWLDPAEVVSYALGLGFPRHPTIQDFLSVRGENQVAGMSLLRRGVPFQNYGRTYLEGARAVFDHTYHRQARETMESFLGIHERIARTGEKSPALSVLLLAAADEFAHLQGVTVSGSETERCLREAEIDPTVFRILNEDREARELAPRYFSRIGRSFGGAVDEICLALPRITTADGGERRAHPSYVLSMILIDIELGRLMATFRRLGLFDRTLFILFGDHGMVDTPRGMTAAGGRGGLGSSFLDSLNRELALTAAADRTEMGNAELGIDDESLPRRIAHPHEFQEAAPPRIRRLTREAEAWAGDFLQEIRGALRANLHEKYWWLFFLRSLLIDPRLDATVDAVSPQASDVLLHLYLRGEPEYLAAETRALRELFDRQVRLVYGGGARNNAELFLPSCGGERGCSWDRRPSWAEIREYRGGSGSNRRLLEALRDNPGVGLIFVREENELIAAGAALPAVLHVQVMDRRGHRGRIRVRREPSSGRLLFHYQVAEDSAADPLGYGDLGRGDGTEMTYREWNDRSAAPESGHRYHNAVAGIGSYLYSANPAIGDVLVLHADGWNFGDNAAGHGGIHREEKTTVLMVAGEGIEPGELFARSRFRTAEGGVVVEDGSGRHYPSLLDVAPTALSWLGYPEDALDDFAEGEFDVYLRRWISAQPEDILAHLAETGEIEKALAEAGFERLRIDPFLRRLARLLAFARLAGGADDSFLRTDAEGSLLILR